MDEKKGKSLREVSVAKLAAAVVEARKACEYGGGGGPNSRREREEAESALADAVLPLVPQLEAMGKLAADLAACRAALAECAEAIQNLKDRSDMKEYKVQFYGSDRDYRAAYEKLMQALAAAGRAGVET